MRFADPHWLYVGLVIVPLLALLLVRAEVLKSRALTVLARARLGVPSAAPSRLRRWLRIAVATFAVFMGFVALARPQKGMHWETMERNGIDLLLVVDTSKSMDADDVKPTRLERTKLAIRDLVDRFPSDRIGLVAFAGDAFVQSPMTLDHSALLESVDALDTQTIARGGTNIGRGLDVAGAALATEPGRQKVMVLMSDGEDLEGEGLTEAKQAAAAGITIDTIGVGTQNGELVPAKDPNGKTVGIVRDEDGKPVRSHLDEAGLRAIADAAHGAYRPLGADGRGLDRLYDESLAKLTHAEASSRTHRVYSEWFEIPLGLALFGVVIDSLLGRRWRGLASASKSPRGKRGRAIAPSLAAAAAALAFFAMPARAYASVESAQKAYAAGHFEDAAKEFEKASEAHPKDARLAFNAGDAAYRAGHYDAAEAAYKRALAVGDPSLQQHVLYNNGDTLYRMGEPQKPEAREATIAKWKAAIDAYEGALALNPKDADAKFNRDFVKRKLKALEEQPKQDPPKDQKQQDQKQNGADDKDKGKKDSSGSGDKGTKDGKSGDKQNTGSTGDKDGKGDSSASKAGAQGSKIPSQPKAAPQGSSQGPNANAKASGQPSATQAQGDQGDKGKDAAQPGRLSAKDARALLHGLRGDEHKGLSHGTASGEPSDDSPRKDW